MPREGFKKKIHQDVLKIFEKALKMEKKLSRNYNGSGRKNKANSRNRN